MYKTKKMLLKSTLGAFLLLGSNYAQATSTLWTGATSNELSTTTNWTGSIPPSSTISAEFNTSPTSGFSLTATTGGLTAAGIIFDSAEPNPYTLTADSQAISIGSGGVINNSTTNLQTLQTNNTGTITIAATPGGITPAGNNVNYIVGRAGTGGSLTFAGATNLTGTALGNGTVTVNNGNTFTVGGDSTISYLTSGTTSSLTTLNGSLTSTNLNFQEIGPITGTGTFILSAFTAPSYYYMYMGGPNTYTGGTIINAGTIISITNPLPLNGDLTMNGGGFAMDVDQVIGNLSGTGGNISWDLTSNDLTINQTINKTYAGTFTSTMPTASLTFGAPSSTTAIATLQLTGNSADFMGDVIVNSGNLQVNGSLGATSVTVNSGATLSGTGSIGTAGNTITIENGAFLKPGNSVGVMTNPGDQVFMVGSTYQLEENGLTSTPPSNNLLIVGGTTTVGTGGAPIVRLFPTTDLINLNTQQAFIQSTGALTVTTPFTLDTSALVGVFNFDLIDPALSHDTNNYYITTQTTFAGAVAADGGDGTAVAIATQLDAITNPNTIQNTFLNELAQLSTDELVSLLDGMSGGQYATELFAAEISSRRFLRRLYDPIRDLVTTEPNPCCPCVTNSCCQFLGFDVWASAGGGQSQVNGSSGLRMKEWNVTFGLQQTFCQDWTFGIAGSYEHNKLNYHSSSGSGDGHTWFGGLYGLYRPSCFYILADLTYGNTKHQIDRELVIDTVIDHFSGKPQLSQVTFYAEGGFDYNICSFLIQPFVGIEVAGVCRKAFTETDLDISDLALSLNKQDRTTATSSLGVHLTDRFCSGFTISIDLAWLYRFTNNNHFTTTFSSLFPAGTEFTVYGQGIDRNSGEGAITFAYDFCDDWRVFVEASGEVWSKASTYNALAGIQFTW